MSDELIQLAQWMREDIEFWRIMAFLSPNEDHRWLCCSRMAALAMTLTDFELW